MKSLRTSIAPRKFLSSLAFLLVLIVVTTPGTLASTATISKTVAVPLPKISTKKQRTQFEVSSYSDCNRKAGSKDDLVDDDLVDDDKPMESPAKKSVYEWYMDACTEKPFLAKGLTSATIAALGDVIAQSMEGTASASGFSPKRVATFFFCNLLFTGPFIHLWYTFLNLVGDKMKERFGSVSKLKMTLTQVFLDQTLGTFVFFPLYIYVYDAFDSVVRLHQLPSWTRATEKCRQHVWGIILTQYRVFPLSNMINFGLVPYEMRVLFTSTVSLFWNIYLCSVVG